MNEEIEKLLNKSAKEYGTSEEYEKCDWSKVESGWNIEMGGWCKIEWSSGLIDKGYLLSLPRMRDDEGDFIVHIPEPNGPGKGQEPPIWVHWLDLLANESVISIIKAE